MLIKLNFSTLINSFLKSHKTINWRSRNIMRENFAPSINTHTSLLKALLQINLKKLFFCNRASRSKSHFQYSFFSLSFSYHRRRRCLSVQKSQTTSFIFIRVVVQTRGTERSILSPVSKSSLTAFALLTIVQLNCKRATSNTKTRGKVYLGNK